MDLDMQQLLAVALVIIGTAVLTIFLMKKNNLH